MRKLLIASMFVGLFILSTACKYAAPLDDEEFTSESAMATSIDPTPTPTSLDLSGTHLIASWSLNDYGNTGSFVVSADGSITNALINPTLETQLNCAQSGSITSITPSTGTCDHASATSCGSFSLSIGTSSGGSSCLAAGTFTCTYSITPEITGPSRLTLDCGQGPTTFNQSNLMN